MNEVLIGSLIDKVDAQENQINELREKVNHIPAKAEVVMAFETTLKGLKEDIKKVVFSGKRNAAACCNFGNN
jgi:predicted ribosome quality control (RQC) complex YloA/Tae2 family protein